MAVEVEADRRRRASRLLARSLPPCPPSAFCRAEKSARPWASSTTASPSMMAPSTPSRPAALATVGKRSVQSCPPRVMIQIRPPGSTWTAMRYPSHSLHRTNPASPAPSRPAARPSSMRSGIGSRPAPTRSRRSARTATPDAHTLNGSPQLNPAGTDGTRNRSGTNERPAPNAIRVSAACPAGYEADHPNQFRSLRCLGARRAFVGLHRGLGRRDRADCSRLRAGGLGCESILARNRPATHPLSRIGHGAPTNSGAHDARSQTQDRACQPLSHGGFRGPGRWCRDRRPRPRWSASRASSQRWRAPPARGISDPGESGTGEASTFTLSLAYSRPRQRRDGA